MYAQKRAIKANNTEICMHVWPCAYVRPEFLSTH